MSNKLKIELDPNKGVKIKLTGPGGDLDPITFQPGEEITRVEPAMIYWTGTSSCVNFVIFGQHYQV
ncbi:MAG: hypothetical protein JRF62_12495 [Deltaproteobacteria bacterium]|nr:hypothetical protein [Deltaproteobacteria bacterium]MBW2641470.1 hypothetical protein [Deltaproteobacteria bacterium]MBW2681738.1 hypothetical protein [Deltaproteobacteria bacterium]